MWGDRIRPMHAVDLHSHTRFFHGHRRTGDLYDPVGFRLLAKTASLRGLDGLATTNHDYYTHFEDRNEFTVVPGIEITTTDGHVLVVGPDPPVETDPGGLTPAEAVEMAHDRGCAAIVAHPFRDSTVREADVGFDAVEVNGKHPRTREWVRDLSDDLGLPVVGGSDAHYPIEVGRAHTVIHADELTPESVVAAIRDGRVESRIDDWLPYRLIRRGYRVVHGRKDHVERPEVTTPGVGPPPREE
jgi:predicted metal-dependent phosphoesterase TrpH